MDGFDGIDAMGNGLGEPLERAMEEANARMSETAPGAARHLEPRLRAAFGNFIDDAHGVIGRVVGSEREPAGNAEFAIWAADGALTLDVGHIVVAFSEEAAVIGVTDQPRRFSDVQSFLDDYFDRIGAEELAELQATARPEMLVFTVKTLATKHLRDDVDSNRPPTAGPVWFATREAIEYALEVPDFRPPAIPALLHTNGNYLRDEDGRVRLDEKGHEMFQRTPILLDSEYLLGPEAGHANWTGQSGLATKTSHAVFLISSAFQKLRGEERPVKVAALMFNVKGSDLLWLDKPSDPDDDLRAAYGAARWTGFRDQDREDYAALGLEAEPFANLRIFAPFRPGLEPGSAQNEHGQPVVRMQTMLAAQQKRRLNTYRNADGETANVFPVCWTIDRLLWQAHRVFEQADLDDKFFGLIGEIRDENPRSLNDAMALIERAIAEAESEDADGTWRGHSRFTLKKLRNRLKGLSGKVGGLLADVALDYTGAPQVDEPFEDQEIRVVDIAQCNTNVQELLVSHVVNEVWKRAELGTLGVEKLIVFVDELNKYAPSGGQGGLRDTLVDIAARGRHLNVVLFGAQQFRSKVDEEILGNCGTAFYGRIGDEEIVNSAYRSLSDTARAELLGLPKGRLLVRHAHFRAPLFGSFPLQPCVPGTVGQTVYNSEGAVLLRHPGDPLHAALGRVLNGNAPTRSQVRNAVDGLSPEQVMLLVRQVDDMAPRAGTPGFDPWGRVQSTIARVRQRGQ